MCACLHVVPGDVCGLDCSETEACVVPPPHEMNCAFRVAPFTFAKKNITVDGEPSKYIRMIKISMFVFKLPFLNLIFVYV